MKILKKFKHAVGFILLAAWSVLLVTHSEEVSGGVKSALMRCVNVIVPSLFAFMTAADMLMRGGAYIYLAKPLKPLAKALGLPARFGAVFLISNFAGYPTGAAAVAALYDKGALDRKSAARLLCACCNGGPAFFTGVIGVAVFGSKRTGLLIYLSVIAANLIFAAVMYRLFPVTVHEPPHADPSERGGRGALLTESVTAAGEALLKACGMMLLFAALLSAGKGCLPARFPDIMSGNGTVVTESYLEISRLADISGRPYRLLPVICGAAAFGGVCVILQIAAIVGGRFSVKPFIAARAVCAVTAGLIAVPMFRIFGEMAAEVSARSEFIVNFNNFLPSVCLIMMIFLTILRKRLVFSDRI